MEKKERDEVLLSAKSSCRVALRVQPDFRNSIIGQCRFCVLLRISMRI